MVVFEDAYLMVGELAIEGNCIFYLISDMMKLNINQLDNPWYKNVWNLSELTFALTPPLSENAYFH